MKFSLFSFVIGFFLYSFLSNYIFAVIPGAAGVSPLIFFFFFTIKIIVVDIVAVIFYARGIRTVELSLNQICSVLFFQVLAIVANYMYPRHGETLSTPYLMVYFAYVGVQAFILGSMVLKNWYRKDLKR